jgi:hypothetical protein
LPGTAKFSSLQLAEQQSVVPMQGVVGPEPQAHFPATHEPLQHSALEEQF